MKTLRVGLAAALMILMMVACANQLAVPKSFDQKVAYANGSLTAVLEATAASLDAHQISSDDARAVREMAKQASGFLDSAQQFGEGPKGTSQLALATGVLTQLQAYLNARSMK